MRLPGGHKVLPLLAPVAHGFLLLPIREGAELDRVGGQRLEGFGVQLPGHRGLPEVVAQAPGAPNARVIRGEHHWQAVLQHALARVQAQVRDVAQHLVADGTNLDGHTLRLHLLHEQRVAHDVEAVAQALGPQQHRVHRVGGGPIALAVVEHQRQIHPGAAGLVLNVQQLSCIVQSGAAGVLFTWRIPSHQQVRALLPHLQGQSQVLAKVLRALEAEAGSDELHRELGVLLLQLLNHAFVHVQLVSSSVHAAIQVKQVPRGVREQVDADFHVLHPVRQKLLGGGRQILLHYGAELEELANPCEDVLELLPNLWGGQLLVLLVRGQHPKQPLPEVGHALQELRDGKEARRLGLRGVEEGQGAQRHLRGIAFRPEGVASRKVNTALNDPFQRGGGLEVQVEGAPLGHGPQHLVQGGVLDVFAHSRKVGRWNEVIHQALLLVLGNEALHS
mmetsp:Transcript_97125/g.231124  ORF Transcript_97125/g.231124 Transcript_97125/m.231124 type:complete len:447 (-) Transcript_97125:229-1569(-)